MKAAQMIEAAKKQAYESGNPYGFANFNSVRAEFVPTSSRSSLAKFKGRVIWKIDGKRASKAEVISLIG